MALIKGTFPSPESARSTLLVMIEWAKSVLFEQLAIASTVSYWCFPKKALLLGCTNIADLRNFCLIA